ncbi:MAG TPA: hypothetical protein P5528_14335 [Steroidobacteraceae bacterium]|nr:hypothetical protein [Steroidobacteraceae bacterium]HRX90614.1 hypothetical protein [Steroidobacteraceae bacterium]
MSEPTQSGSPAAALQTSEPATKRKGVNELKVKLVGEIALSNDTPGFDPYNSSGGKTNRVAWQRREDRR